MKTYMHCLQRKRIYFKQCKYEIRNIINEEYENYKKEVAELQNENEKTK